MKNDKNNHANTKSVPKVVGVSKTSSGKYGARINDPLTKKQFRLGVYNSEEEAVKVLLAKKAELLAKKAELHKEVEATAQTKIVGVSQLSNGKYGARIRNPFTKKDVRLGVFSSQEEAVNAYLAKKVQFTAKKAELEKEKVFKEDVEAPNVGVSQTKFVGVSELSSGKYGARIKNPSSSQEEAANAYLAKKAEFTTKKSELEKEKVLRNNLGVSKTGIVGVCKSKGKYCARIRHPSTKKRLWLGTFNTKKEAFKVYLAKKTELENEVQGNQRFPCVECKGDGMKNIDDNQSANENNNNPCSENQDHSSMEGDFSGSPDQETTSSNNNSCSEKSEASSEPEGIVVSPFSSSISSNVEILLMTKTGEPVMDTDGFLLGNWSWIDDLSLP